MLVGAALLATLVASDLRAALGQDWSGPQGIEFPATGASRARAPFLEGVFLLHNFEYKRAAESFRRAARIDPDFLMARWGEALTHHRPLWSEEDVEAGREALRRIGSTPTERAARARTERERGYLRAVEALFGDGDVRERTGAYEVAMARLAAAFPDDDEARLFHALALMGVTFGEREPRRYMRAAAIAEEIFAKRPGHPGAAHYLIHAYDDPTHAPLGLRAAEVYAAIAPESPHALHMPSHIFFALGRWQDVELMNRRAVAAAERLEGNDATDARNHAAYWLHYSLLQQGRNGDAEGLLADVRSEAVETGHFGTRWHASMMSAQQAVHDATSTLEPAGVADVGSNAHASRLAALAWRAWRAGRTDELTEVATRAESLADAEAGTPAELGRAVVTALAAAAAGRTDDAVAALRAAADREEARPYLFGPPLVVKPPREALAELLLDLGRPDEAERELAALLERHPGRRLVLEALAARAQQATDAALPRVGIAEDLDSLLAWVSRTHPDPYRVHPRPTWRAARDSLVNRAPLTPGGMYAGVLRLVSLAADGHMDALPGARHAGVRAAIPLKLVAFPDGVRVVAGAAEHRRALGAIVTAIEGVPIDDVVRRLAPLVPSDNVTGRRELLEDYLRMPALLDAVGVDDGAEGTALSLEVAEGSLTHVVAAPADTGGGLPAGPPRRPLPEGWLDARALSGTAALPLWQRHLDRAYWFTTSPEIGALYVQINRVVEDHPGDFGRFVDELVAAAEASALPRLVLDLRTNRGGDATILQPLIHAVLGHWRSGEPGTVFVLTSSYTFSAAVHLAAELERNTHALFVGEPTAAPPNHFADVEVAELPNSGITIEVSALYWQKSDPRDRRSAIFPDLPAPMTGADFLAGRDPALEAIAALDVEDPRVRRDRSPVFNWLRPTQRGR